MRDALPLVFAGDALLAVGRTCGRTHAGACTPGNRDSHVDWRRGADYWLSEFVAGAQSANLESRRIPICSKLAVLRRRDFFACRPGIGGDHMLDSYSSPAASFPSLAKGIASASLAPSSEARGLKISMVKLDPLISTWIPGTMSRSSHGEFSSPADVPEADLDLRPLRALRATLRPGPQ